MNRRLFFILLAAVTALTVAAQPRRIEGLSDIQRAVGYTVTDDIDISGAAFGEAGTYTIGAALDPSMLAPLAGCRVVGIRVAAALNLGRTRMFVYSLTDTAFKPVVEQRQRIYEGWNNVFLNGDGYEIKGDETLFFGYDYVETQAMVDADQGGICCVGEDTEGAFYLYGDYGQGEALYTIGNVGKLCVQLIVDISTLPRHALSITYLDTGFKYKKAGTKVEMLAVLTNVGRDSISSYQLGCQIDQQEPLMTDCVSTVADGAQDTWLGSVQLPDDLAIGMHTIRLFVNSINGQEPERHINDSYASPFAVYQDSLPRANVYLEVYTDQASPYSAMLNDAVRQLQQTSDKVCVANVHRSGTPLAVSEASYLCDLYAYTYPSFTVNRAYFPGEPYVAYDMNDYLPYFGTDMSAAILGDIVMQDIASPAFADLTLQGDYQADTRQLTLHATGQLLPEAQAIYGDLALTLLLTEDGVKSRQAVYNATTQRTTYNQNYVHNNVLRAFIGSPLGQQLTSSDGTFDTTVTTILDDSWSAEKLTVVGLLTKATSQVTPSILHDMDVINANCLKLSDIASTQGIISTPDTARLTQHATRNSAYYTLDGKKVDAHQLLPGIYIQRAADGTTRKVCIR